MLTIGEMVKRNGLNWPERDAFVDTRRRFSWAEFDARTDALGHALRGLGVRPGDRVAMLAADCIEVAELLVACAKIGAIRVGLNYRLAAREIGQLLADSQPSVLLVQAQHTELGDAALALWGGETLVAGFGRGHGYGEDYETWLARGRKNGELLQTPAETLMICYTTGSTGLPKGAIYPHEHMVRSIHYMLLFEGATHEDVWLHTMPAGGVPILHLCRNLFHASTMVVLGPWDPERALRLIERERVTLTVMVPTMLAALIASPAFRKHDVSSMRQITYGASPLPPATIRAAMKAIGCDFLQMYGTTELTGMASMLFPSDHERGLDEAPEILASAGRPLPYVETRIVDEDGHDVALGEKGELIVRSELIVPGYWNDGGNFAETVRDGWLYTGDIAYSDQDGYLYLADRAKFRIKTGGYNVFPVEVENVLAEHPAVMEVGVIGLPDTKWGERIHAVVALKRGFKAEPDELRDFCAGRIATFKVPKTVEIWSELPKGPTGKIQKRDIIERLTQIGAAAAAASKENARS